MKNLMLFILMFAATAFAGGIPQEDARVLPVLSGETPAGPSAGRKIKVACIGDSITYGSAMTNRIAECYPAQLQKMLGDRYEVRNFGDGGSGVYLTPHADSGGWTPHPWRKGARSEAAYAFRPDVVIGNFGINDVGNHDDELKAGATGRPFSERGTFVREYVELLKAFKTEDERTPKFILWTRLGPVAAKHCLYNKPWAAEMEPDLRKVADEIHAIGLDMYTPLKPFVDTPHFAADGIHPEGGAQKVIAEITAEAVAATCVATSVTFGAMPVGDGVTDDTAAIQSLLDEGRSCVYLPPPKDHYVISKTLENIAVYSAKGATENIVETTEKI